MALLKHPAQRVVASSLFTQGLLVLSGPIAVRLLGVEGRGELAFVFAGVLLFGQIAHGGLPQAWAYSIAQQQATARSLIRRDLRRYFLRSGVSAALGVTGLLTLAAFTTPLSNPVVEGVIIAIAVVSIMVTVLGLGLLQGAGQFTALALLQAVPGVIYTVGLITLMVMRQDSVVVVLIVYFSGWALIAALTVITAVRASPPDTQEPPSRLDLRSYGRRAIVAAAAPIDNLGIDQLLIGGLLAHHGLGLYTVALAFETAPVLVLISIGSVCMTGIASLTQSTDQRRYARTWLLRGLAIGVVVVAGVQLIVDPVLPLAFGEETRSAIEPARVLAVAGLFLGLRRLSNSMLQGVGRPGLATVVEISGLTTMVVAMVTLVPASGLIGGCYAMLAGGAVATVLSVTLLLRSVSRSVHLASGEQLDPR